MKIKEITVSGDLGEFKTGQKLTTTAEIGNYFRTSINEGRDEGDEVSDTTLSDETIQRVINETDITGASVEDGDVDVLITEALEDELKKTEASA